MTQAPVPAAKPPIPAPTPAPAKAPSNLALLILSMANILSTMLSSPFYEGSFDKVDIANFQKYLTLVKKSDGVP